MMNLSIVLIIVEFFFSKDEETFFLTILLSARGGKLSRKRDNDNPASKKNYEVFIGNQSCLEVGACGCNAVPHQITKPLSDATLMRFSELIWLFFLFTRRLLSLSFQSIFIQQLTENYSKSSGCVCALEISESNHVESF